MPDEFKKRKKFPQGFFWGSASSSYQVEGGVENCDWAEAGRKTKVPQAGRATDHYNRFREDFDIAKKLNHNAHRLSIEWSRIEPREGEFDREETEHYRTVLRDLRSRGIEPFVTMWHFTLPLWFAEKGGFLSPDAPWIFSRYAYYLVKELGGEVIFWATMNEPIVYASNGFLRGTWPPFKKNPLSFLKATKTLYASHNLSYAAIKKDFPFSQVGVVKNNMDFQSNWNPLYVIIAAFLRWFWNKRFMAKIKGRFDFIGLNYYFHKKFGDKSEKEKTDMGWDIFPKGIFNVLKRLKKHKRPIYVTENGLADADDSKREKFIKEHLYWVSRAIGEGTDVRGYFYWSLTDNFEWAHGYAPRFGLVEIDYATLARAIRDSAVAYAAVCKNNSLPE